MKKNEFKDACKLHKIAVSNYRLVSICRIIIGSCCLTLILSACATTTSEKTSKSPAEIISKHNPVAKAETELYRHKLKDFPQKKTAPVLIINNMAEALSYCDKTRVLSMRMANLYGIQVLQGYPAERKQNMKEQQEYAMSKTNEIYKALLAFAPVANNTALKQKVKLSQYYWFQMKKVLSGNPSKEEFLTVLNMSDKLLGKNDTMRRYLGVQSTGIRTKLINIAERQRVYSMKLARDYLAAGMNIDKEHRMNLLLESAYIFDSAMLALEGAPENTDEIKGLIKSITKMEWRKVYETVNQCIKGNGTKFNLLLMVNFCETLLKKTDRLTMLYTEAMTVTDEQALTSVKKEPLKAQID
jgi:hypothetical protein